MKFKVSCSFVRKAQLHHLLTYPGVSVDNTMEGWLLVDNSSASSGFDRTIENGETRKAEGSHDSFYFWWDEQMS